MLEIFLNTKVKLKKNKTKNLIIYMCIHFITHFVYILDLGHIYNVHCIILIILIYIWCTQIGQLQPVLHNCCNKVSGMYYAVSGILCCLLD